MAEGPAASCSADSTACIEAALTHCSELRPFALSMLAFDSKRPPVPVPTEAKAAGMPPTQSACPAALSALVRPRTRMLGDTTLLALTGDKWSSANAKLELSADETLFAAAHVTKSCALRMGQSFLSKLGKLNSPLNSFSLAPAVISAASEAACV